MVEQHASPDAVGLIVGSAVAATRRIGRAVGTRSPANSKPDLRYAALGALLVMEERVGAVMKSTAQVAWALTRPVVAVAAPLVPDSVRRDVARILSELDEYGRTAVESGSREAGEMVESIAGDVATDPAVIGVIENVVDRIQWRVVDAVLPVVLDRLAAEPEQVRELVQRQSRGMVDEITDVARSRAAVGDEAVERVIDRLLHRRGREPRGAGRGAKPAPKPAAAGP